MLFYPGCAGHQDTPSHRTFAKGFLLEEAHITYFFDQYLSDASQRGDWRFAPLDGTDEAGQERDLEGVAPAWIGLAECDPLVDEGVMYADRLRMQGVPVDRDLQRRGPRIHPVWPRNSRSAHGAPGRRTCPARCMAVSPAAITH
jgi:acetyl esterase